MQYINYVYWIEYNYIKVKKNCKIKLKRHVIKEWLRLIMETKNDTYYL